MRYKDGEVVQAKGKEWQKEGGEGSRGRKKTKSGKKEDIDWAQWYYVR